MIGQQPPPNIPARTGWDERWRVAGLCLVLAGITFAIFGQTLTHDFVDFDDRVYVYGNPVVAQGVTLKGIGWAFTHFHASNWHPLTWISHMMDCQLYGLHPGGHHLTNVLLHAATVILLFLVLRQMTGALWRSAFIAAVFAIHPLRVESVAWVAERKDVLSGLFFMLTIGAYARCARAAWSPIRYALVLLLFALGLMCKPMLVTLPLVLLLLDYWPLQRTESPAKLIMEKLPLLALSGAACVVTILAQSGAIRSGGSFSLPYRLGNALAACTVYLRQMVWPAGLAVFYPYPRNGLQLEQVALAGLLLAGLSAVAIWQRRKQPWLVTGWFWYLVMLLPVLGIIQVGSQSHADRYTYLPQIGIYVALAWLAGQWQVNRVILGGLMAGALGALMVCAWRQTASWQNSETLWAHEFACAPDNEEARYNLGFDLLDQGRTEEAIKQFELSLQINPDYVPPRFNLAVALMQQGKLDEALTQFTRTLEIDPNDAEAHNSFGIALLRKGKKEEAAAQFEQAAQLKPDYAQAHYNLANILLQSGRIDDAIGHYEEAVHIDSGYAQAHVNLGGALLRKGNVDDALLHFQQALQIDPSNAPAHVNLGNALLQKGNIDDAIAHFQDALKLKPDFAEAHSSLGATLCQKRDFAPAITQFQQSLQLEPNDPDVQNSLAWLLATCPEASLRNGEKAVQLAQQASQLTGGRNPAILRTLAAAYAEVGRFDDAKHNIQAAIDLLQAARQPGLAAQLNSELKLYEAGLPFRK